MAINLFSILSIDTKMTEHPTKAKEVLEIFEEVALRRREAEIVSLKD